jgi:hypothetical protein
LTPPLLVSGEVGAHGDGGSAVDDGVRAIRAAVGGKRGEPQRGKTDYGEGIA